MAWGSGSPAPGLLAAGADLEPNTLIRAYRQGIFPWFSEGEPCLWWCTHPRMVLHTNRFRLSDSLRKQMLLERKRGNLRIAFDTDFLSVILACAKSSRRGQTGTWITDAMVAAYHRLHKLGVVHSVEVWWDGTLAGGLYCLNIGHMVYGESMFTYRPNASKMALAALVAFCRARLLPAIDCQQVTNHLASLGAAPIDGSAFQQLLKTLVDQPTPIWTFDPAHLDQLLTRTPT